MGKVNGQLGLLALLAVAGAIAASDRAASQTAAGGRAVQLPSFIDSRRLPDLEALTAEAEAKRKAEEQRQAAEAEARRKAEEQRQAAEAEAKRKVEEERRQAAEAEAKRKADEDRRLAAEAEAKRKAEEQRQAAEAEAKRKVEEERRQAAEAEAKRKAEEERRQAAEAEARRKAEEQRQAAQAEAKRKAEEEQRQVAEARRQAAASVQDEAGDGQPALAPAVARLGVPPSAVLPKSGTGCGPAKLTTSAVPGGRASLAIESSCRAGRKVSIRYGDFEFVGVLDASGRYTRIIDLFLGKTQAAAVVSFADGTRQEVALEAADLDEVSKVALVWKSPVNLDLHAYEYAAAPGGPGHVWPGRPAEAAASATQARTSGRGAGFLSSIDDGEHEGDKVEVYTFWHNAEQTSGTVSFTLDYETRGSEPSGETCAGGTFAEVAFEIVVLSQRGNVQRESGLIKPAKCGEALTERARYTSGAVPDLKIRKN